MKTKRRTWRWVCLDVNGYFVHICPNAAKPRCENGFHFTGSNVVVVCPSEFRKLFGLVPQPGECLKVEFKGKVVKS